VQIKAYDLLEVIGSGGMGTVYRGQHRQTGQTVAVKVMPATLTADRVLFKRFEQECTAALRLCHPHIVQGIDFGLENDRPYLVMELVDGHTLAQYVDENGPLNPTEAIRIAIQIAGALHQAHQLDLIHRDVKPENILLTRDMHAKLADLGLVKDLQAEESITRSGTCLGTIVYMAPEQFGDAKYVDVRCDVYALAATLYFALTGLSPFPGRGDLTILGKKVKNEYVPLTQFLPTLAGPLTTLIHRSLDARVKRRPATCQEFADLLAAAMTELASATSLDGQGRAGTRPEDRRQARRYPTLLFCSCESLLNRSRQWTAHVVDMSRTGARLQVDRRFEPGTLLSMDLPGHLAVSLASLLLQVHWVRQGARGKWEVGCSFTQPLSEGELNLFLGNKPPTVIHCWSVESCGARS
jgi:serine/threonine protein kinase